MKQLRLEVGKAYRSREGEEVRIVGKYDNDRPPYQGNNGNWYTESGKWDYFGTERPEDLIEEIPETQHTFALVAGALTANRYVFNIPEDIKRVTASREGNRIVVEMVPEKEPKPGDVMVNENGSVYIFKSVANDYAHKHCACLGEDGHLFIGDICIPGRPATPEEAQPLWDALKKAGKRWNPEAMQVEDVPEFDRILEWVEENLDDGHYNKEDIADVISYYLDRREGEKCTNTNI